VRKGNRMFILGKSICRKRDLIGDFRLPIFGIAHLGLDFVIPGTNASVRIRYDRPKTEPVLKGRADYSGIANRHSTIANRHSTIANRQLLIS